MRVPKCLSWFKMYTDVSDRVFEESLSLKAPVQLHVCSQ